MTGRGSHPCSDGASATTKTLGLLGADVAAAGVLAAVHDAVNRFWWLDATGLAVAGLLLLAAV